MNYRQQKEASCGINLDTAITFLIMDIPSTIHPAGTLPKLQRLPKTILNAVTSLLLVRASCISLSIYYVGTGTRFSASAMKVILLTLIFGVPQGSMRVQLLFFKPGIHKCRLGQLLIRLILSDSSLFIVK